MHVLALPCSSSVGIAYVVRLRIVFSKAALRKRGSMEPMEPPLDPPLLFIDRMLTSDWIGGSRHTARHSSHFGEDCQNLLVF